VIVFADPRWLWGLALLPVLFLFEWRLFRRSERSLKALVGTRTPHGLLEQRQSGSRRLGMMLRLAALAALFVGAAGPEWGTELVRRTGSGSDVLMLIDVSASMDVRDVPPSRIAEARREALALLERLEGSRVGVIAFAGDAVRLAPLTQDRAAVRLVLEALSSATVSEPGSDLGRALRLATKVLPHGRREEQAIVLWTDGEDLQNGARQAIDELATSGIRVFAVGVGTPAGDVVPVLDDRGRAVDVKRDEGGSAVRSRLDESLLRTIARRTRGGYFAASRPGGELPRLLGALGGLARSSRGERLVERPVARFPLCAAIALLLLAFDLTRPRRKVQTVKTRVRFSEPAGRMAAPAKSPPERGARRRPAAEVATLLALAAILFLPSAARAQSAWAKGDRAYQAARYAEAESLYALRAARGRVPPDVHVNRATAAALAGRRDEGEKELGRQLAGLDRAGRTARYNLGTLRGGDGEFDEGLDLLRKALEANPADEDARWNYEILLRRKREQERKGPKKPDQDQPPQPSPPSPNNPGQQNPQPNQGSPPPQGAPQQQPQNPGGQPPPTPGAMTRAQAEQLLGALQDLQRAEQQKKRKVRVMSERRGKDW